MHCLIIDDNSKTSATLCGMLEAIKGITVHKAVQPYMIRSLMAAEEIYIEIVFIRIRLWDFRQFEKLEKVPVIVFLSGGKDKLTNHPDTTVRYTLREPYHPIMLSALLKAIAEEKFTEAPEYLFLRYKGRFHKTMFSDIEMIERMEKNYAKFFLVNDEQFLPGSLPGWLAKLPNDRFIRVSDNLIVPAEEAFKIGSDEYVYKGRKIKLTFRFANAARNEMEHWPDGL
jgi:DNA-binding LytR/AlgR family response regulator